MNTILKQARKWLLSIIPIVALVTTIVLIFLIINTGQPRKAIQVSLYEKSQILPLPQVNESDRGQPEDKVLRVAIAGVLSPSKTLESYQELLSYMGERLGIRVTMILKPTYAEINDLIRSGGADIAFVCSLAYVKGNEDFGLELLVAPQIRGHNEYYSYLIVPKDSDVSRLEDLKGGSFVFTDPLSNTGHLVPVYQLSLLNETPVSFFRNYIYSYSHDNSIKAVANKLVSGGAVDSLVYDQLIVTDPEVASKTKIISTWGPYGMPPVVVGPTIDPLLEEQLKDFFLSLHESEDGAMLLNSLSIDKFIPVTDDSYASIRKMKVALGW